MGELRAAYGLATAGFVGGTLVPIGGHNLLEPVAVGRAVLFGPHTSDCADVADLVLKEGVGRCVAGAGELAEEFLRIAGDSALRERVACRARALMERERGASERCAGLAHRLLGAGRAA
jgi:3-deoxy-D-manno-octulosonic-acid transferase